MMKKIIFSAVAVLMISGAALGGYAWHQQSQIDPMILANVEALSWDEGATNAKCPGEKKYSYLLENTETVQRFYHNYYLFVDQIYAETSRRCIASGSGTLEGNNTYYIIEETYGGYVPCEGRCRD